MGRNVLNGLILISSWFNLLINVLIYAGHILFKLIINWQIQISIFLSDQLTQ